MAQFLFRRAINYVVLVFLAATLTYFIAGVALEPIVNYLQKHPQPPIGTIHNLLRDQNLDPDTPVAVRYWHWLTGVLHGDFGTTYTGDSVASEMGRRIFVSTELLFFATVLSAVSGVAFGAWNALRQYRPSDKASTIVSYAILATPTVVIAVTLQTVDNWFGSPIQYIGMYDPNAHGTMAIVLSNAQHLILPTLTLWLIQVTLFSRFQRSTMLDVLGADYLRTARAKGLTMRQAVVKHGLRTAVIPVMPLLVYNIILLFTGATFTETIFAWHGMGEWLISSIQNNDVNATAAIGVFTAGLVLVAGLVSDMVYAALDPRVRA
ncbi:ABC transporter permease [Streptomyces sp. RKAG293]|uniref:ABC transporter permease n=1 Tax=Streptomyces sp. RKAG293 TaxID=2893403 RepID=UPI00203489CF|nr:ABC transporter permease [Streptomyces sp. RKAG293]MCM2416578.1 ABC transporter permease [Streptomyces sp. RKAG293]